VAKFEPIPSAPKYSAPGNRRRARARWRASALAWVAAVLCLVAVFAPDPPLPVVIALAVMPWLAMLMARAEAPSRLVGRLRGSLLVAVIPPALALGAVGLAADGAALDWRMPLIVALVAGAPMAAVADAALRGSRLARGRVVTALFMFACMSVYAYGALSLANARLDSASPERFRTAVIGKRITHGRGGTHWHLRLAAWGPQTEPGDAEVRPWVYRAVDVGGSVCVDLRPGALGIAWYVVLVCEAGG
jgi:hypothetical protein